MFKLWCSVDMQEGIACKNYNLIEKDWKYKNIRLFAETQHYYNICNTYTVRVGFQTWCTYWLTNSPGASREGECPTNQPPTRKCSPACPNIGTTLLHV